VAIRMTRLMLGFVLGIVMFPIGWSHRPVP